MSFAAYYVLLGAILMSGCAGPSASDYLRDGDNSADCARAIESYRRVILSEALDKNINSNIVTSALTKVKTMAPTCAVRPEEVIDYLQEILGNLRRDRSADAGEIAAITLSYIENHPSTYFEDKWLGRFYRYYSERKTDSREFERYFALAIDRGVWEADDLDSLVDGLPKKIVEPYAGKIAKLRIALPEADVSASVAAAAGGKICNLRKLICTSMTRGGYEPINDSMVAYVRAYIEALERSGMRGSNRVAILKDKLATATKKVAEEKMEEEASVRAAENRDRAAKNDASNNSAPSWLSTLGAIADVAAATGGKNASQYQQLASSIKAASGNGSAGANQLGSAASPNSAGFSASASLNSPYGASIARSFPAPPALEVAMCRQGENASQKPIEMWANRIAGSASGVCQSAKANFVITKYTGDLNKYCAARAKDANSIKELTHDANAMYQSASESLETAKKSCN